MSREISDARSTGSSIALFPLSRTRCRLVFLVILLCSRMQPIAWGQSLPTTRQSPAGQWGRIANSLHHDENIRSALFFAGPPNPNTLPLYTRHPQEPERYNGANEESAAFALKQMKDAGLNTIKLSYWGHEGETEKWSPALLFSKTRWPGETQADAKEYTEAEQTARGKAFFRQAQTQGLLVAPMLEVSPAFRFYEEFPARLDPLVARAEWLLRNFGKETNWLQVYDQNGKPRHAVWLIETIHAGPMDPKQFAHGFEEAGQRLKTSGYSVGFIIDPTPLPPYGSHAGPESQALRACPTILAINPFNITSQGLLPHAKLGDITEPERQEYAESILKRWSASGIPLIAPIMPGYDAHLVFPDLPSYGFNATWRQRQKELALQYQTAGISIDIWNGWAEGYAIPHSREEGSTNLLWVQDVLRNLPRSR